MEICEGVGGSRLHAGPKVINKDGKYGSNGSMNDQNTDSMRLSEVEWEALWAIGITHNQRPIIEQIIHNRVKEGRSAWSISDGR